MVWYIIPWTTDAWQLDSKFFRAKLIAQIQINISLKCLKSFFCRKNSWLIQNQGLGRHGDKVYPKSATKNTENTQNLFGRSGRLAKTFGMFWKKKTHQPSLVHISYQCNSTMFMNIIMFMKIRILLQKRFDFIVKCLDQFIDFSSQGLQTWNRI